MNQPTPSFGTDSFQSKDSVPRLGSNLEPAVLMPLRGLGRFGN
jgi:hypothetical protein